MICRSDARARAIVVATIATIVTALTVVTTSACDIGGALGLTDEDIGGVLVRASVALEPLPPEVAFTFHEAETVPCSAALVDPVDGDVGVYAGLENLQPLQITSIEDVDLDGDGLAQHMFGRVPFARWSFIVFAVDAVFEQRIAAADIAAAEVGRGCTELTVLEQGEQTINVIVRAPE